VGVFRPDTGFHEAVTVDGAEAASTLTIQCLQSISRSINPKFLAQGTFSIMLKGGLK